MIRAAIGVYAEVANALELIVLATLSLSKEGLDTCFAHDGEGLGIEELSEFLVLSSLRGVLIEEETVVETHFGRDAIRGRYPVDRALDLAVALGATAERLGVVLSVDLDDIAVLILLTARAAHDVGALETHLLTRGHAEVLLRSILQEVLALDEELTREADRVAIGVGVFGVVEEAHILRLPLGVVRDNEAHGVEDGRATQSMAVEILTDSVLEEGHIDDTIVLRVADLIDEAADRLGRIATTTQPADRRHTRVIPACYVALLHELEKLTLAHHRVGEVQTVELNLSWAVALGVIGLDLLQEVYEVIV